jgi:NAD(P)-dependent dehydrogenase (short-subunit alcohol dehydrogenase family)
MTDNKTKDSSGLAGRVCVVTGGGSGIGRAISLALAKEGAKIAVLDLNATGAEGTAALVAAAGGQAAAFACDTADEVNVFRAAEQSAARLGGCDVLVNNAGILRPGALDVLTVAEWNQVLAVNLTGYFLCAQAFGKQMRKIGKGAIVHTASIAANHATANAGAYSVAKAGIQMLSRQLAAEWGVHGIRSNVVNPGLIVTPMSQAFYDQPGVTERRSQAVPLGRVGAPEDIAQAVVFLASDRAAYISGQEIAVDGGFTQMLMGLIPRAGYEREAG